MNEIKSEGAPHQSQPQNNVDEVSLPYVRKKAPASIELVAISMLLGIILALGAPLVFSGVISAVEQLDNKSPDPSDH